MNKKELEEEIKNKENELAKLKYDLQHNFIKFETIVILAQDIKYTDYNIIKAELKDIMVDVDKVEDLGLKKLAYKIRENERGIYLHYEWQGNAEKVREVEKYMREENNIIKFITIKLSEGE